MIEIRRISLLLVSCVFLSVLIGAENPATGQTESAGLRIFEDPAKSSESEILDSSLVDENSLFVPAPREVLRPLLRAQKAIKLGEYSRAVALLGETLADSGNEDYLVRDPSQDGIAVSLRRRATDLLGMVPKKHRELYELRYGIQAKHLLDKAVEELDYYQMSQIMRRFFYTRAGYDATMLVGHYHLDQGRPIAAAFSFKRIVDVPEARALHDPEASVLLATCWMLADDESKASKVLLDLKRRQPNRKVNFLGKEIALFFHDDQAIAWLRNLVGDSPLGSNRLVYEWVMHRGNPQRNANSGSGFPLLNSRWSVPTLNDPDLEKIAKNKLQQLIFSEASTIPSVHPIAVGDTIVMRTFNRMIGVDFKTGRRMWSYPSYQTELFFEDENLNSQETANANKEPVEQRLFQDSVFGQMSSDGHTIFVVPQPGFAGGKKSKLVLRGGNAIDHPLGQRPFNELIAADIAREGAFKWEVGGKDGLNEPKLAEAFFLGPPLPLNGELYAVCEQSGEIRLVVLDPQTGSLRWSQQLASVETGGSVAKKTHRRLAGATPSFSDGLLICPTGHGAIIAVDVATRSLLWGFQYGSVKNQVPTRLSPTATSTIRLVDANWKDSAITIADGAVIYTPSRGNDLICLDLISGRPLWEKKNGPAAWVQRENSLFVGAVDMQHVILIGLTDVRSIDLATGEESWRLDIGEYGRPSGQGYANDGFYYLPMTSANLLQVDMRKGIISKTVQTDGVLGNLICYRGDVVSHGVDRVAAFPQDAPNRIAIKQAEARGPLSADHLALKSQLLMQEGKLREAADFISQAYDLNPNRGNEKVLIDLIIQLIEQSDYEFGIQLAEKYEGNFDSSQRPRFQTAKVDGLIRAGALDDAFQIAVDLLLRTVQSNDEPAYLHNLNVIPFGNADNTSVSPAKGKLTVRYDRWMQARIQYLIRSADGARRERFLETLDKIVGSTEFGGVDKRFQLITMIGCEHVSPSLLERCGRELFGADFKLLGASLLSPDELTAKIAHDTRGVLPATLDAATWNRGLVSSAVVPLADELRTSRIMSRNVINVRQSNNGFCDKLLFRFDGTTGQFEILDQYGKSVSRFGTRGTTRKYVFNRNAFISGSARISGYLMLVNIATEVFAIDLSKALTDQNGLLWSHDVSDGMPTSVQRVPKPNIWGEQISQFTVRAGMTSPVQVSFPSVNGCCYIDGTRLICADALTGETLWQRSNILSDSELLGDDNHVIVWNTHRRTADVFELSSGQFLKSVTIDTELGSLWDKRGNSILFSGIRVEEQEPASPKSKLEEGPELEPKQEDAVVKRFKTMTLVDLVKNKTVWQRDFDEQTAACRLRNDKLVALLPDGNIEFIDFESGQTESKSPIAIPTDELERATTIFVSATPDAYLVRIHCSRPSSSRSYDNSSNMRLSGTRNEFFWNGYLASINRKTRRPTWSAPAKTQFVNFATNQPYACPLQLLIRRVEDKSAARSQRYWTQVIALDLRNGRTVASALTPYSSSYDYRVEAFPEQQTVSFSFHDKVLHFQIGNEVPPPRPVAMLTSDNSVSFATRTRPPKFAAQKISEEKKQQLIRRIQAHQLELQQRREAMTREMDRQQNATRRPDLR